MAAKKNSYIGMDIEFAETQIASYRKWLEDNPYEEIADRKEVQLNKKTGGSFLTTVQTKEAIQKAHRDTTKEYLQMIEVVDRLRSIDEVKKKAARGMAEVPEGMEDD